MDKINPQVSLTNIAVDALVEEHLGSANFSSGSRSIVTGGSVGKNVSLFDWKRSDKRK